MFISWKHQDDLKPSTLTIEEMVEIFYEQTLGWQLHIADLLANGGVSFGEDGSRDGASVVPIRHSGFAVLQICLSYFETIGYYTPGRRSGPTATFKKGFRAVFSDLADGDVVSDEFAEAFYRDARCGLYHNVKAARVGLGWPPDGAAIAYLPGSDRVVVSPERLPGVLKQHLERFRVSILNQSNVQARRCFVARFSKDFGA